MKNYILRKIFNKFQIFFLQKIKNGLYVKNKNKSKIKKILFYLNDIQVMHLGDFLFLNPVIKELIKHGFDVEVSPTPEVIDYIKANNIKIFNNSNYNKFDLIITKVEFISFFKKSDHQILFVNTTCNKIKEPLCISLINRIFNFLTIKNNNLIGKPNNFIIKNSYLDSLLREHSKYILFNNYTHSGKFRIFGNQRKLLINCAIKLKKNGFKIIYIGTKKDKDNDKDNYQFVDLDLRGKTSISDLFYLTSKNNVVKSISFDTMLIIIFSINNKKSFVVTRKRLFKSNQLFIKKYVHLCFNGTDDLITYLD